MSFITSIFKSRDKPVNRTAGSGYTFFMGSTTSGMTVTERSAMQMTAVYSCVRILAEAIAGLPLHLYRYTEAGGKEKAIEENAHISIMPEVYAEKCNALVKRHETAKSKYDALQENLSERTAKRERIEIYLKELSRAENLVTAFDDGLWNTMVDTLTIYSKERIVFRFRDGSEIEWSIR